MLHFALAAADSQSQLTELKNTENFNFESLRYQATETYQLPHSIEITKIPIVNFKSVQEENNYWSKEWIAIYVSLALTAITLSLAIYTYKLWQSTNEATIIQLRAYIGLVDVKFSPHRHAVVENNASELPAYFDIGIQNQGQTPASNLTVHVNFHVAGFNEELPDDFEYPDYDRTPGLGQPKRKKSAAAVGAGYSVTNTLALNERELELINLSYQSQINLYVYGWIRYKDVFKIDRETQFCYLVGHHAHGNFSPLTYYHEHNVQT